MEYVYPARFAANSDGSYTITYPDLPGCVSEGKDLPNAMYMAQCALEEWLEYLQDGGGAIPTASALGDVPVSPNAFANLIRADVRDNAAIRRTVSIPKWLDDRARDAGLSLSRVLQDGLKKTLKIQ